MLGAAALGLLTRRRPDVSAVLIWGAVLIIPAGLEARFCRGVVEALDAGADLLLSYDSDQYYRGFTCALEGLRRRNLPHLRSVALRPQRGEIAAPTAKSTEISARSYIADM